MHLTDGLFEFFKVASALGLGGVILFFIKRHYDNKDSLRKSKVSKLNTAKESIGYLRNKARDHIGNNLPQSTDTENELFSKIELIVETYDEYIDSIKRLNSIYYECVEVFEEKNVEECTELFNRSKYQIMQIHNDMEIVFNGLKDYKLAGYDQENPFCKVDPTSVELLHHGDIDYAENINKLKKIYTGLEQKLSNIIIDTLIRLQK